MIRLSLSLSLSGAARGQLTEWHRALLLDGSWRQGATLPLSVGPNGSRHQRHDLTLTRTLTLTLTLTPTLTLALTLTRHQRHPTAGRRRCRRLIGPRPMVRLSTPNPNPNPNPNPDPDPNSDPNPNQVRLSTRHASPARGGARTRAPRRRYWLWSVLPSHRRYRTPRHQSQRYRADPTGRPQQPQGARPAPEPEPEP